jgi:HK97 family phage prohead protease
VAEKAIETRTFTGTLEVREETAGVPTLTGYAATFNQSYDLGWFMERIDPCAFDRTLAPSPDARLLIDHEGQPLARTKSGTLTLGTDERGLTVRAELDPTDPDVQRLLPKMRRGDLDQMSFAFRVPAGGDDWSPDMGLRTIREINLTGGDVSVVTYPANPSTEASVRARDEREAVWTFATACFAEYRAGKTISAENVAKLQHALDLIHVADVAVDAAQPILATVLGVPNPDEADPDAGADVNDPADAGDMGQMNSGRPLSLARRQLQALGIR